MTTTDNQPPVPCHPEPHTMKWSDMERDAILAYGDARVAHALAQQAEQLDGAVRMLEIIAVGDSDNPVLDAGRELVAQGIWSHVPAPQGQAQGEPVTFDNFDDGATADAIRSLGIKEPTLKQITDLQKAMAGALSASRPHAGPAGLTAVVNAASDVIDAYRSRFEVVGGMVGPIDTEIDALRKTLVGVATHGQRHAEPTGPWAAAMAEARMMLRLIDGQTSLSACKTLARSATEFVDRIERDRGATQARPEPVADGVFVDRSTLMSWKDHVNTLATLSLKDERYRYGRNLKQAIADVLADLQGEQHAEPAGLTDVQIEAALGQPRYHLGMGKSPGDLWDLEQIKVAFAAATQPRKGQA